MYVACVCVCVGVGGGGLLVQLERVTCLLASVESWLHVVLWLPAAPVNNR